MEDSQPQEHQASEYVLHRCAAHPDVETGLSCGRCATYICPRCMVQTPVGARCNACARVSKIPTYDVQPSYYLRAVGAGVGVAILAGLAWGILLSMTGFFLAWMVAVGAGYAVGEAISAATNRKRGTGLAVVAGASMTLFAVFSGLLASVFLLANVFGLMALLVAYYVAINRVR